MQHKKVTLLNGEELVLRNGKPIAVSVTNWMIPRGLTPEEYKLLKSIDCINPGYNSYVAQRYLDQLNQSR